MRPDFFVQPLFNPKLVRTRFAPLAAAGIPAEHRTLIEDWAQGLKTTLAKQSEVSVRPIFLQKFFEQILGYTPLGTGLEAWTIHHELATPRGSVDAALGLFSAGQQTVIAPFELKGPKTHNLDAQMAGRFKSPVQQAWEYAADIPGTQFILVSNCDEIRLYAFGWGRMVYESWHVADLLKSEHYASFVGLLGAAALTSGQTAALLRESVNEEQVITQKLYQDYKSLREDLILGLSHLNNHLPFREVVRLAQKLIDRLLFMAFAQSRRLLPKKGEQGSLEHAASYIDGYNPQPKWKNFLALFKAIDSGSKVFDIPAYNGGLFAPDPAIDALEVSDKLVERFTKLSGYDYAQEVSVTVLGRIFEQSITDLERIADAADIEAFKLSIASKATSNKASSKVTSSTSTSVSGKRKRDGVVYTPDHITRFIVDQTLTPTIHERFNDVLMQYQSQATDLVDWRAATKEEKQTVPKSVEAAHVTEYHFWQAWSRRLGTLRVCDPACGSGAFLVAAFDVFKEAYTQIHLRLRELAPQELLEIDISHQILECNLFGVDINPESIEITKLSLWLKTAEYNRKLAGLDANFYEGNSLVEDASFDASAFDWARFDAPLDAHCDARFDVILGNPPYVRQELFGNLKPYLQQHYKVYHGVADLLVYFYELGLRHLAVGGRLGFISSSSFFKTSSGEPLRRLLRTESQLEVLVDFGDWQVFEGVTTYPAVVVTRKIAEDEIPNLDVPVSVLQLSSEVADLKNHFADHAQEMNLAQLGSDALLDDADASFPEWQIEGEQAAALRAKLFAGHPTLKEVVGSPLYGIKTGLNEAFIVDRKTRDAIVYADSTCEGLLKPFLRGDDIERWRVDSQDLWLILLPKGWTNAQMSQAAIDEAQAWNWLKATHSSVANWLEPFADAARKRTDQGDYWWELRACNYYDALAKPKIIYPDIAQGGKFSFDNAGAYFGNTAYFLQSSEPYLVAILNSKAMWYCITGICEALRGGVWRYRMFTQHIETLPIPQASPAVASQLSMLASQAQQSAQERQKIERRVANRLLDLAPRATSKPTQKTLSEKLKSWWALADFAALTAEVKNRFGQDIPLKERDAWQELFTEQQQAVKTLTARIHTLERTMDTQVYALFGLEPAEIKLIENAVE